MTSIESAAHELRLALQDCGMVWDKITGPAEEEWLDDVEITIANHISDAIRDALEARTGR